MKAALTGMALESFGPLEIAENGVFIIAASRGDYHIGFAAESASLKRALRVGELFRVRKLFGKELDRVGTTNRRPVSFIKFSIHRSHCDRRRQRAARIDCCRGEVTRARRVRL